MQTRSVIILIIGLIIALGTAWSLKARMTHPAEASGRQVLVAAANIGTGDFVRSQYHLAFANWPEANITEQMLTSAQVKLSDFDGAVARRDVGKGEPIQKNMLVKPNEGGFMAAVLDPGKRAVSIAVDSTTGNAGFIFPGDYVDLILTHAEKNDQSSVRASETFIENVRVLAVDQMLTNPDNKAVLAKTVTLEVSPKQAEKINVAKDLGKINLSLRSLANNHAPEAAKPADKPIESFDDVLKAASEGKLNDPPSEPTANFTRDPDVSHIITPNGGANMHVRVLHGNKQEDVEFGPAGMAKGNDNVR